MGRWSVKDRRGFRRSRWRKLAAKPDSLTGQELLQQRLTGPQKVTDFVIVRSSVGDTAFRAHVTDVAARIQSLGPDVVARSQRRRVQARQRA